jgi:hypothetical protein
MCRNQTNLDYMSMWHNKPPIQRLSLAPHMKPWQVTLELSFRASQLVQASSLFVFSLGFVNGDRVYC